MTSECESNVSQADQGLVFRSGRRTTAVRGAKPPEEHTHESFAASATHQVGVRLLTVV